MRRLFTVADARFEGRSEDALRWKARIGACRRVVRGVYAVGPEPPSALDIERAKVIALEGVASGGLAAVLHGLDAARLDGRPMRRRRLPDDRIVCLGGIRCTDALQTVVDLAATLDDDRWEQALESALRNHRTTLPALREAEDRMSRARTPGVARLRRVLERRGNVPPTESLLETLMVQLARKVETLDPPERQVVVHDEHDQFVARVDLAWPRLGMFVELDGQQHAGQPIYDARRETAVVAATGWLCGRFTWYEVVHVPRATSRRLAGIALQAHRRRFRAVQPV